MGLINKFPDLADEFEARPAASWEVAPEEGGMDDAGSIASEDNNSIETVADSPVESPEEVPIEQRLEAPRTEMTEKYGEETRQLADSLITRTSERDAKWDELVAEGGADTRPDLWEEYVSMNDECAKLEDSVKNGTGVIEYPSRKTNESWGEYEDKKKKMREEFSGTMRGDPYAILRLAEAGRLTFSGTNLEAASTTPRPDTENPRFTSGVFGIWTIPHRALLWYWGRPRK